MPTRPGTHPCPVATGAPRLLRRSFGGGFLKSMRPVPIPKMDGDDMPYTANEPNGWCLVSSSVYEVLVTLALLPNFLRPRASFQAHG